MTKKRNSRKKKQSSSFIFFLLITAIILALAIYSYRTNSDFKSQVDETVAALTSSSESQSEFSTSANVKDIEENSSNSKIEKSNTAQSKKHVIFPKNLEKPVCPAVKNEADHEVRNFENYSICYRESYEQAEWSAYCLTEEELTKNAGRSDNFRPDPKISTGSATPADYKKSGYDRGHLSPAADFAFSAEAMSETFYMSNMSPQAGSFNRGIWKDLESEVRIWAKKFGRVYVISGPILEKPASEYKSIGENHVSVPEFYYKVILAPLYSDEADRSTPEDAKSAATIAFIFPNDKCEDSIFDHAVTVNEVESRTHLDFFYLLEDDVENSVEDNFDKDTWIH